MQSQPGDLRAGAGNVGGPDRGTAGGGLVGQHREGLVAQVAVGLQPAVRFGGAGPAHVTQAAAEQRQHGDAADHQGGQMNGGRQQAGQIEQGGAGEYAEQAEGRGDGGPDGFEQQHRAGEPAHAAQFGEIPAVRTGGLRAFLEGRRGLPHAVGLIR